MMQRHWCFLCCSVLLAVLVAGCARKPVAKKVAPQRNAFDIFQSAGNALVQPERVTAVGKTLATVPSSPDYATLVKQNAAVLAQVREGFAYPYQHPPVTNINHTMLYLKRFRDCAYLFVMEAREHEARGDYAGAAQSCVDGIRLGVMVPRGGVLTVTLVGHACEGVARRELMRLTPQLDATTTKRVLTELAAIEKLRAPYSETVKREKVLGQAFFSDLIAHPEVYTQDQTASAADRAFFEVFAQLPRKELELMKREHARMLDALATRARRPYAEGPMVWPKITDPLALTFLTMIAKPIDQGRARHASNRCLTALLRLGLAEHAYHLAHQRSPASLQELVPTYLSRLPADPFARDGQFRYRLRDTTPLLYSCGFDGDDDGGMPITGRLTAGKPGDGDIVYGVNMQ